MDETNIQAAADAFTAFLQGLQTLEDLHGPALVVLALKRWKPFSEMDLADEVAIDDVGSQWLEAGAEVPTRAEQYLQESYGLGVAQNLGKALWSKVLRPGGQMAGKVWKKLKNKMSKPDAKDVAKVGTGAGGTAAATMTGAAGADAIGDLLGTDDITIGGVDTNDSLNIRSKEIEELLTSTHDAIQQLLKVMNQTNQDLGDRLKALDTSVDDMISSETGETPLQVANRQAQVAKTPGAKLSVVPTSDENDEEKRDPRRDKKSKKTKAS